MAQGINNPETILKTLDGFLHTPIDLVIYGRGAIALGFPDSESNHRATLDVDAILPNRELESIRRNDDFWDAQEKTNEVLKKDGLYITHLFCEDDVILTSDWESKLVRISGELKNIRLFRPATADLILTKMMRNDEVDLADIKFLIQKDPAVISILPQAIENARLPDVSEIRELFYKIKPKVLQLVMQGPN